MPTSSHPLADGALGWLDRRLGTSLRESIRLALQLSRAAASGPLAPRMVLAGIAFGLRPGRGPVRVRLRGPRGPVAFTLPDFSGLKVLWEVFVGDEYAAASEGPPRAILDLGANIGASCLFFRLRYPSARIVAVEPNPELVPMLRHNVRDLGVEVVAAAVAPAAGTVDFYPHEQSWHGSTALAHGPAVRVPAVAMDDLIADDVDLVKIDVEGAELELIPASRRLSGVRAVLGEIHALPDSPELGRVLEALERFDVELAPQPAGVPFVVFRAVASGD